MKVEFSAFPKALSGNVALFVAADKQLLATAHAADAKANGALTKAFEGGRFTGAKNQTLTILRQSSDIARLLLLGVGKGRELDARTAEGLGGVVAAAANAAGHTAVTVVVDPVKGSRLSSGQIAAHLALGARLRNYRFDKYKTKDKTEQKLSLEQLTVVVAGPAEARKAYGQLEPTVDAVFFARDLVSEPANVLYPVEFARRAKELTRLGVKVEILGEAEMKKLGMNVLLGVGQGSERESQLLVMRWMNGPKNQAPVALIGKGVTFDTGGISLKPADGMERMKDDMAGGATVVAALRSIALQQLPINAIAVVPMTENMPGGKATKPGDILRSASGLTVEVNNTDAEGRLILGDALWYARQLGATHVIDVATLTGAIVVALGKTTTGLFGTPEPWVNHIRAAAVRAGEKLWPLPLFDDYREQLKSEIADMVNSPGRPAGAVTAAMFLKEFAGDGPWAHLDIAGTAWAEESKPWQPKGATGTMIRTLVDVARAGLPDV